MSWINWIELSGFGEKLSEFGEKLSEFGEKLSEFGEKWGAVEFSITS